MKKVLLLIGFLLSAETCTAKTNSNYALATGQKAAERLNKQGDLIKEFSYAHLAKAGLKKGQIVADIGCGSGVMTAYLAEQVGPTGHVYAIDNSQGQLDVTKRAMADKNLTNVSYILSDLEVENEIALSQLKESVDLAYMRLVLMHLKRPDIAARNIHSMLKAGGVVANQESLLNSVHTVPACTEVCDEYAKHVKMAEILGTDRNIGGRLEELYIQAGFKENVYYKKQIKLPMKTAHFVFSQALEENAPSMIAHKVMTREEIDTQKKLLTRLGKEGTHIVAFDQGYIVARK